MAHPKAAPHVERERFRARVEADAKRGTLPSDAYAVADLEEAFAGREDELADLERIADRIQLEKRERLQAIEERAVLERETKRVLDEWDREERSAKRAKATTEAKRRLKAAS